MTGNTTDRQEVAVYVDLENLRYSMLNTFGQEPDFVKLVEKAKKYGRPSVMRAYADFAEHPEFIRQRLHNAGIEAINVNVKRVKRPGERRGVERVKNAADMILALLPPEVPLHRLSGDEAEIVRLKKAATGGYLVVGEFAQAPIPTYIWGAPVRRVFDTLDAGYSLAVALHAASLQETFDAICLGNGVTDEQASRIGMMLYIRRFGRDPYTFVRRLSQVHEIDQVQRGRPLGRLLHRWVDREDRFEVVNVPSKVRASPAELAARTARLGEMVAAGRTTAADVTRMVADYHLTE